MVAVGGAAAAFHGTLSNNFQIPGTETQQMADKLKKELPSSSGGSASVVFEANGDEFSQAGKDAVTAALTKLKTLPDVQGTVDPFATQAQLDKAAADLAAGKEQSAAGKAQLEKSAAELAAGKAQLDGCRTADDRRRHAARCDRAAARPAEGGPRRGAGKARRRHQGTGSRRSSSWRSAPGSWRLPKVSASSPRTARPRSRRSSSRPRSTASTPRSASRSRTSSRRFPPPT